MEKTKKKIQVVQYGLKSFASMGFIPNQQINRQILGGLVMYFLNVFLNVMYLLYEANTFWEYTNSMFISLTSGVGSLLFTMLIFQAWRVFEIIDFGQKFIEDSK